jgi:hypothetical protein
MTTTKSLQSAVCFTNVLWWRLPKANVPVPVPVPPTLRTSATATLNSSTKTKELFTDRLPLLVIKVKVKIMLRLMVSQYVCLGVESTLELVTRYYFLSESCCVVLVIKVEVEVTLRPTVSRPVRLGVVPLLEQVTRCYIYLSDNYFLYFSCRAPSLTRGRVCNLQCNDASSISSYIATDGLSASSSWCRF